MQHAAENREEFRGDALIAVETIAAVIEALPTKQLLLPLRFYLIGRRSDAPTMTARSSYDR